MEGQWEDSVKCRLPQRTSPQALYARETSWLPGLLQTSSQGEADSPPSTRIERGETSVRITVCATLQDQSAFSSSGIRADFVVQYDVVMEDSVGDVQICDGYFVHYFAPRSLPPVEKNVVLVIDASGSMFGTKMKQVTRTLGIVHSS
ncbi:inter-alpha-trypsin inhibitor heavy chain H6-like [Megaptera novaeangliae]